jgi:hypothetical protein
MRLRDFLPEEEGTCVMCIVAVLLVFLVALCAHGTVGKKHDNSIGTIMYTDNPMTYKAGSVISAAYVDGGMVVRMQPIGTYALFTEDFLFCGNDPNKLLNKSNPMILTYRTKASRMVEGIGCHELVRVDEVKERSLP